MLIVALTVRCLSGFDSLSERQCCLLLAFVGQESLLEVELTEFLDVLLMFSAAPMLGTGDPGFKFRDLVVVFSRWGLGPTCTS